MQPLRIFFYLGLVWFIILWSMAIINPNMNGYEGLTVLLIPFIMLASPTVAIAGVIYAYIQRDVILLALYITVAVLPICFVASS